MLSKTKIIFLVIFLFSFSLKLVSQETETINKISKDINEIIKPDIVLDAVKGELIFSIYKFGDLKRESSIFIKEIDVTEISYSTKSKQLSIPCLQKDCAMHKIYGNQKTKKYNSNVRIEIQDTVKGKKVENLFKIMLSEMNNESIVRVESESNFIELSPHLVSIMIDQLFYLNMGLSYEFISKKERLGYKTFLIYSPKYTSTELGLALKIYLGKNKANIYNFGGIHLGTASIRYYTGPEFVYYTKPEYDFVALRLQNGVAFQSKKHFNFTLHTSMGAKNIISSDGSVKTGETSFSWGLYFYFGYRF